MQGGVSTPSVFHRLNEGVVAKELTAFDSVIDPRSVHADYASRADVQMPDLAVAHLPRLQTDVLAGRFDERVGILLVPLIEMRRVSKSDRVTFSLGGITKPVENYQDTRRVVNCGQTRLSPSKRSYRLQARAFGVQVAHQ